MKIENGIKSEMTNISEYKGIKLDSFKYERTKLDYEVVKRSIYNCKNQPEMAAALECSVSKLQQYLRETDLYQLFCEVHKVEYHPQKICPCAICGETRNVKNLYGVPYCKRHYNQMYRYGKPLETTIYDKNDIIVEGNIAKIIIRDKNQNIKCEAIIDAEDIDKIKAYKWYERDSYCVTKGIKSLLVIK